MNEDLTRQLAEARKTKEVTGENEGLSVQLQHKDEEIETLKKENLALIEVCQHATTHHLTTLATLTTHHLTSPHHISNTYTDQLLII